jgi:putative nucleotidyltransferase with HDIG domain
MPAISELIEKNKLRSLLQQYSTCFDTPVFLLNPDKSLFIKFPEDTHVSGYSMKPLDIKASTAGYVALPEKENAGAALDFICRNLSCIAEMSYEIESLSGEVVKNYEELSLLWRLSSRLGAGLQVSNICAALADEVMRICPSNKVLVLMGDEADPGAVSDFTTDVKGRVGESKAKHIFMPKISMGKGADRILSTAFDASHGLLGQVYEDKNPLTVSDVGCDARFEGFPFSAVNIMIVPLVIEDSVIGAVIAADKLDGQEYFSTEIKLIHGIATECALSIRKALLFEEIRTILFSISESFASAIEAKDPYTFGHSRRVAEIATAIAREMGFSTEEVNRIRVAALLHDIGKIGTPENILNKNARLNKDEMETIKEHPARGAKMIGNISRLKEIASWIRHHHERNDGEGYPSGFAREDIPTPSKIIAVADCYDALTSDRPYRKSLSKQEAMTLLTESVGTQFDPVVFEYFLKVVNRVSV